MDFNRLHLDSLRFLHQEVNREHTGKMVVVSHYVPTLFNYPKAYKGSVLNEAFASELFDFIVDSPVDYWIYGHHHHNTPDFTIGRTSLITNQLGYVRHREHRFFELGKVIRLREENDVS